MNDDEVNAEFEADAAASPERYRALLIDCELWSRKEMLENLRVVATATDIAEEHLRLEKLISVKLVSIGQNLEKIANRRFLAMLTAQKTVDLATRDVLVFIREDTKKALGALSQDLMKMIEANTDLVDWPTI